MPALRLRRIAAPAVLAATALFVLAAGPAQAADGASITLNPQDVVTTDGPLTASGTCPQGSRSAVVTLDQNGATLDQRAVTVAGDLTYTTSLKPSKGTTGLASAHVDCFRYADAAPLASSSAEFLLVGGDLNLDEVEVTVSPSKVAIGSTFTVSAACPAGTTAAEVLVGGAEADEPFLDEPVEPAADGTVEFTTTLKAGKGVEAGSAGAMVICGNENEPTAIGFAEFTILRAAANAAVPAAADPTRPQLAMTGSDNGPIAAAAAGAVLLGAGLHFARRKLAQRG